MTYPRSLSMRDGCLTVAMTDSNTKRTQVEHFLSISVLLETIYAYYEHTGTIWLRSEGGGMNTL